MIQNARVSFEFEALEQRVLLSADPLGATVDYIAGESDPFSSSEVIFDEQAPSGNAPTEADSILELGDNLETLPDIVDASDQLVTDGSEDALPDADPTDAAIVLPINEEGSEGNESDSASLILQDIEQIASRATLISLNTANGPPVDAEDSVLTSTFDARANTADVGAAPASDSASFAGSGAAKQGLFDLGNETVTVSIDGTKATINIELSYDFGGTVFSLDDIHIRTNNDTLQFCRGSEGGHSQGKGLLCGQGSGDRPLGRVEDPGHAGA